MEKALLSYRRQMTLDGIRHVVREFAGRSSRNSVFLAEIGKWPHQAADALTFSGDIDFSFVSNDTQLTFAMKQAYDQYIQSRTGLTAGQIDSVSTAGRGGRGRASALRLERGDPEAPERPQPENGGMQKEVPGSPAVTEIQ